MSPSSQSHNTSHKGIAVRLVEIAPEIKTHLDLSIPDHAASLWRTLNDGPVLLNDLDSRYIDILPSVHLLIQHLWTNKAIGLICPAIAPELEVVAATNGEVLDLARGDPQGPWKLSRFAFIHLDSTGTMIAETPCVPVNTRILKPRVAGLLSALARPRTTQQLEIEAGWNDESAPAVADLMFMLRLAGVVGRSNSDGQIEEDMRPELQQWEPHDLLFHHRSRQGRHDHPIGGDFRFKGRLSPQPAVPPQRGRAKAIALPRPDLRAVAINDAAFTIVLESRRSIREQDWKRPISLHQLSEFLFRSARIRSRYKTDIDEFTSRPYPSGGASYELEIYVTVNHCAGLDRGFYYYDAVEHALYLVHAPGAEMEAMLDDAWLSAARMCRPQVLLTLASRFQRVSWKYSGMAYATHLKNVGVLYQTFYLVATAMHLAGCGLGLGNSSRFCRLAGTDYFKESSIGEFMLGARA